jgi:ACS family glucarate transporter-like MFS transporter
MPTRPSTSERPPIHVQGEKPTRARYWMVVFAVTLAILSYIDRVCISQAAPVISQDLGLSKTQMGYIFSSFAVAYALFEIPGGWMGDVIGPRKVLMRIVLWWSGFTALTGFAWNFSSLFVVRFLFGAGEAGCFPNLTKAFSTWLPTSERVRAQGIMWTFARWGGAFTPPLVVLAFTFMSWQTAFVAFGALGVVWAFLFYNWYRDNPRDHKGVNAAELALLQGSDGVAKAGHGNVPWKRLLTSRSVWLLWLQYFCLSYPWYFFITWLPTFLKERYPELSDSERSYLAILPLFCGGLGSLFCGFVSGRVTRLTGSISLTRRLMASIGFFGAGVLMISSMQLNGALTVMMCIGLASFFNDLVMPGAWATCMDVGGSYAGTVSGSMNMMGNLAGFVAPVVGGYMRDAGYDWSVFIYTMGAVYFIGTLCWPFIDPVTPIDPADRA